MVRALIASLAILFSGGTAPLKVSIQPSSGTTNTQSGFDQDAERQLLDLANQARTQAGLPPLQADDGLREAARRHASIMAAQRQLSHRFNGEAGLPERLAKDSNLHLDRSGENVAYAGSADQAQDTLMHSPPHRENLLNPEYNVAGFGVVRNGNTLYVTQDFAHKLPTVSAQEAEESVAKQINLARNASGLPHLRQLDESAPGACLNSSARVIKTSTTQARYILRYTSMDPANLPAGMEKVTGDRDVGAFSVNACYERNSAYPNGAYWVVVQFF
jgi:uncharacterized protein YkwD